MQPRFTLSIHDLGLQDALDIRPARG
jgi:hypothetical protein